MITHWFFGRDPGAGNATSVHDPRLQAHRLVASSGEVLDHEGAVLRHLGRVQLAVLLLLHCAKADVLHLVLLNLCTRQLSLTIFDIGFSIYLAFLVLLWQAHDELNGRILSCDQTQLGTAVLTDLGGHLALHQLTGSALLLLYQRSRTNAERIRSDFSISPIIEFHLKLVQGAGASKEVEVEVVSTISSSSPSSSCMKILYLVAH